MYMYVYTYFELNWFVYWFSDKGFDFNYRFDGTATLNNTHPTFCFEVEVVIDTVVEQSEWATLSFVIDRGTNTSVARSITNIYIIDNNSTWIQ